MFSGGHDDHEAPQQLLTDCVASGAESSKKRPAPPTDHPVVTEATGTSKGRVGSDWNDTWSWEIGAALLSVVGFALLISFLTKIHGTSYEFWQYTTSPNTVVSIITTITKAAAMVPISTCLNQLKWNHYEKSAPLGHMQTLDQSSRGPWGSLVVLWRSIPGLQMGHLPLVGACLTILALAVGPFSQQILVFPSRVVLAPNETASILRAHNIVVDPTTVDSLTPLVPWLTSSILAGLTQAHSPTEPQCTTNNCTYPGFVTLGICTQCEDVTSQATRSCATEDLDWWQTWGEPYKKLPIDCTYTWSSLQLDIPAAQLYFWSNGVTVNVNDYLVTNRSYSSVFGIQSPVLSFLEARSTIMTSYSPENASSPLPMPNLTACTIYYCEKEYSPSSYSGQNTYSVNIATTQQLVPVDELMGSVAHLLSPNGSEALSPIRITQLTTGVSLRAIISQCNITQCLDSLAGSMTDAIRLNGPISNEIVPGEAFVVETFIEVCWLWIILPAIVIVGSCGFLLTTALASRRQLAILWKDSVIALIMSHLDTTPEHEIASLRNVRELLQISEEIHVALERDEGPLVFFEKRN
ncbi:hypothetical protein BJX62DRAFT_236690 [Aspergillus germanicus]